MGNVFSKMYLVPEDSMKKFKEESQISSLLDSAMLKILKLKIEDSKKWYLYRQLLMKYAHANRNNLKNVSVDEKKEPVNNVHVADFNLDPYTLREEIEELSMLKTPQVFRPRAKSVKFLSETQNTPPGAFRDRSVSVPKILYRSGDESNILTDDETFYDSPRQNQSNQEQQKSSLAKRQKKLEPKNLFDSSTPQFKTMDDFFQSVKNTKIDPTKIPEIPTYEERKKRKKNNQQQGSGKIKWTIFR